MKNITTYTAATPSNGDYVPYISVTTPTLEQCIELLSREIKNSGTHTEMINGEPRYPAHREFFITIRDLLTKQNENTLPLELLPEGWKFSHMNCLKGVFGCELIKTPNHSDCGNNSFEEGKTPREAFMKALEAIK